MERRIIRCKGLIGQTYNPGNIESGLNDTPVATGSKPAGLRGLLCNAMCSIYARTGPAFCGNLGPPPCWCRGARGHDVAIREGGTLMRLAIEIAAAALLVFCISATSAAVA